MNVFMSPYFLMNYDIFNDGNCYICRGKKRSNKMDVKQKILKV